MSSRGTRTPTSRDAAPTEKKRRHRKHSSGSSKSKSAAAAAASSAAAPARSAAPSSQPLPALARPLFDASYLSGVRTEAAESRALISTVDVLRREADLVALSGEVARADELAADLEQGLRYQADLLATTRVQLIESDAANGEYRELKLRAEHEAGELKMLLDAAAVRQRGAEAEIQRLTKAVGVQGEELRTVAAKLHAHREAESKAFAERRRVWERTVEQWLSAGLNKRIDPLVYSANKDVYTRLQELLSEEQAQREAQTSYLAHASTAELEMLRASMGARIRELEIQNEALVAERFDFGERLGMALTKYLKDQLAAKATRAETLEREQQKLLAKLSELREDSEARGMRQVEVLKVSLSPLAKQLESLGHSTAEIHRTRQQLADEDPRKLLERQQRLLEEAQAEVQRGLAARDKLAAELRAEQSAHAIARQQLEAGVADLKSRSMEFGEKEYYQVTMGQLQELQQAKDEEIATLTAQYDAKASAEAQAQRMLTTELEELRRQRQSQAAALAEYASLEAEWSAKHEALASQCSKLQKDNKSLKKKASKLPGLEKAVLEMGREDVEQLRTSVQQLQHRLRLAEEGLETTAQAKQQLRGQLDDLKASGEAEQWLAREQMADREDVLNRQQRKVKEGLAQRVVRQWLLRTVARCWKAWTIYVVRKNLRREVNMPDSEDESPAKEPVRAQSMAPQQRIADAINGIANFF